MASIILTGDESLAGKYLSWAKNQLAIMKRRMKISGLRSDSRIYVLENEQVRISISSAFLQDRIMIAAEVGEFVIICFVGDTTGDFSLKVFYNDSGQKIGDDSIDPLASPSGWSLKDDGLYGLNSYPPNPGDPWSNEYVYDAGGLRIPSCGSGISAKTLAGKAGRYVLNGSIEDEAWAAWSWTVVNAGGLNPYVYNFVQQVDSLICAPYAYYGPKPYFSRYRGDKIVAMFVPWNSYGSTYMWDAYYTHEIDSFLDVLPKVSRVWSVDKETGIATGVQIPDYGDSSDAISAAAPYLEEDVLKVRLVHANTFLYDGWEPEAEPFRTETLDMETGVTTAGAVYERCPDPDSFYRDPSATIGVISDDARLIFGISESGKQTYVRIQKTGDFATLNIGLYCGDKLVEETGWVAPVNILATDTFGPIIIHPVRYRVIQAHQQDGFNAVVYSKTTHVNHASELIGYNTYNAIPANRKQARKTMVISKTSYYVSVNGTITDLEYSHNKREYKITISPDPTSDPGLPVINSGVQDLPWVDANYDAAGSYLSEDNSVVMRCDMSASKGRMFLGFDVYPLAFRHDLGLSSPDNYLVAEYDTAAFMFPPSSDAGYPNVKDRKWMIFGSDGKKIKDVQPPQKSTGGHVNRINGLAFMGA